MDERERGKCVDAETKIALLEMKDDIIKEVGDATKAAISSLEDHLTKNVEIRFKSNDDTITRHTVDIKDLYDKDREMREKFNGLGERQGFDEGIRGGVEVGNRTTEITWQKIAGIIGIIAVIFTAIGVAVALFIG